MTPPMTPRDYGRSFERVRVLRRLATMGNKLRTLAVTEGYPEGWAMIPGIWEMWCVTAEGVWLARPVDQQAMAVLCPDHRDEACLPIHHDDILMSGPLRMELTPQQEVDVRDDQAEALDYDQPPAPWFPPDGDPELGSSDTWLLITMVITVFILVPLAWVAAGT